MSEQAIRALAAEFGPEAEMLAETAIYGETVEERTEAAARLGAMSEPAPEPPTLIELEAARLAPAAILGSALALKEALGGLRLFARQFNDQRLSEALASANGEALRVLIAARKAL
jgi:hypothetical protein